MANRFPLIVNPDTKEIQEISQSDNLDLTGNGVYAGGSLGQNGQVLTTNGTSVEWRTVTSGGGGGGLDSDTTYIIETIEQSDGVNLNLVAGGSGIGTISIKIEDTNEIQFDAPDNLTVRPSFKPGGIANDKLANPGITFNINGVQTLYELGDTVAIPSYGDVYKTAVQDISNKTFTDCNMSLAPSAGNSIVSIPNSSLVYSYITINGTVVQLGGSITIAGGGGGGTGTTYTISAEDWSEGGVDVPSKKAIRLTGSDASTDNVLLVAGDRISLSRSGDEITITGDEVDTDTNTTYGLSADTLISNSQNVGARLRLTGSDNNIDYVNLRNGVGVTINSTASDEVSINLPQNIETTSDVTFNNLNVTGGLTVTGALSYINTTNLKVTDKTLTIADGVTNTTQADGAGILLGTSNINFYYANAAAAWTSSAHFDVVPTKTYKIGGTEALSATRVLGKTIPSGDIVGTQDYQSLTNKTIINPVISTIINTGTLTLPAPSVADTLVGRATSDILTNKSIDGTQNSLTNIGNSSLTNSYMIINGTTRNLGDSFTVNALDEYTDEKAQDAVAGMITNATHTGISWTYDDTAGTLAAVVTGGGGGSSTLAGLTDVDLVTTAPNAGEVLSYNGTEWISALPQTIMDGNFSGTFTGNVSAGVVTSDSFVKNGGSSSQYLMADGSVSTLVTNANFSGTFTGNVDAGTVTSDSFVKNGGTSSQYLMADGSVSTVSNSSISDGTSTLAFNSNNDLELACHIIPDTNAAYDLGSAEYKIRHLFLSDNSIYTESGTLRLAQHAAGGTAQATTQVFTLAKIKEVMAASADFGQFKANIDALVDD